MDLNAHINTVAPWLKDAAKLADGSLGAMSKPDNATPECAGAASGRRPGIAETCAARRRFSEIRDRFSFMQNASLGNLLTSGKAKDQLSYAIYQARADVSILGAMREAWGMPSSGEDRWESAKRAFASVPSSGNGPWDQIKTFGMRAFAFVTDMIQPGFSQNVARIAASDFALKAVAPLHEKDLSIDEILKLANTLEMEALRRAGITATSGSVMAYALAARNNAPGIRRAENTSQNLALELEGPMLVQGTLQQNASGNLTYGNRAFSIIAAAAPYRDQASMNAQLGPTLTGLQDKLPVSTVFSLIKNPYNPVYTNLWQQVREHSPSDQAAQQYMKALPAIFQLQINSHPLATDINLPPFRMRSGQNPVLSPIPILSPNVMSWMKRGGKKAMTEVFWKISARGYLSTSR